MCRQIRGISSSVHAYELVQRFSYQDSNLSNVTTQGAELIIICLSDTNYLGLCCVALTVEVVAALPQNCQSFDHSRSARQGARCDEC